MARRPSRPATTDTGAAMSPAATQAALRRTLRAPSGRVITRPDVATMVGRVLGARRARSWRDIRIAWTPSERGAGTAGLQPAVAPEHERHGQDERGASQPRVRKPERSTVVENHRQSSRAFLTSIRRPRAQQLDAMSVPASWASLGTTTNRTSDLNTCSNKSVSASTPFSSRAGHVSPRNGERFLAHLALATAGRRGPAGAGRRRGSGPGAAWPEHVAALHDRREPLDRDQSLLLGHLHPSGSIRPRLVAQLRRTDAPAGRPLPDRLRALASRLA